MRAITPGHPDRARVGAGVSVTETDAVLVMVSS
jgi:hypothetical protein